MKHIDVNGLFRRNPADKFLSSFAVLLCVIIGGATAETKTPDGLYGFRFLDQKSDIEATLDQQGYDWFGQGNGILVTDQKKSLPSFRSSMSVKLVSLEFDQKVQLVSVSLKLVVRQSDITLDRGTTINRNFEYLASELDRIYKDSKGEVTGLEHSIREWNVNNAVSIRLFWNDDIFSLQYSEVDQVADRNAL